MFILSFSSPFSFLSEDVTSDAIVPKKPVSSEFSAMSVLVIANETLIPIIIDTPIAIKKYLPNSHGLFFGFGFSSYLSSSKFIGQQLFG